MILLRSYNQETKIDSLKIGTKLLSLFLISSIIPIIFVGTLSYSVTRDPTSVDSFGASLLIIGGVTIGTIAIFAFYTSKSIVKPILKIEIVAEEFANEVKISIKDNGSGIPDFALDKLFHKFYQVDTSLTREHGGSGLGLSICKGIVESHDGKIMVESKLGQGTTCSFTLPKIMPVKLQ